nr:hypothetical protein [uncultured Actinoplanes sp.]
MFLSDLVGVLWRRWYVVVLGALLTAFAADQAIHPPDRYLASEVLLIRPPVSEYAPNAVTGLHPSVAVTAAAMASRLSTEDARERFKSLGVTGTYSFAPRNTGTNQEPRYVIGSMAITNITGDEAAGLRSLRILSDAFQTELKDLQDSYHVRRDLRITVAVLVPPTASLLPHSPSRSLVGAALLGALGTGAVMLWADEIVRRRRTRPAAPEPGRFKSMDGELVRSGHKL